MLTKGCVPPISSLIVVALHASFALGSEPWWDGAWRARQRVTVGTAAEQMSNYPVRVTLSHLPGMSDSFEDVRFVDPANGNTPLFCYRHEYEPRSNALFFVKVPWVRTAETVDVDVYFDNRHAALQSDGTEVFTAYDDFGSEVYTLAHWDINWASAGWAVTNGCIRWRDIGGNGSTYLGKLYTVGGFAWGENINPHNHEIRTRILQDGTGRDVRYFGFRFDSETKSAELGFNAGGRPFCLETTVTHSMPGGFVRINGYEGEYSPNTYYDFRFAENSATSWHLLEGDTVKIAVTNSNLTLGDVAQMGFTCWGGDDWFQTDYIFACKTQYPHPEPAITFGSLERIAGESELAIQSFDSEGTLSFNEVSNAVVYRVEWAPSAAGPWTNFAAAAESLGAIVPPAAAASPAPFRCATVSSPP